MSQTTIGQVLVNDALPLKFRDYDRTLTKGEADALLAQIAKDAPSKYREISWKLMQLGREASFSEGTTLKLSDLRLPFDKSDILNHVNAQEKKILADKTMTPEDKEKALEAVYGEIQQFIVDQTYKSALAANNPFALQVKSKARGNPSQLAALLSTPAIYQDAQDRTIPVFIRKSYAEGLDPYEYWAATYGARKAIISTKFATRDAGALGKQFGTAVSTMVVTKDDCGTPYGVPVATDDDDSLGSVLARPAANFPAGTVVNKAVLAELKKKKVDEVVVRSPMTCNLADGLCKQCVGIRESGRFPEIGYHVGLNAASALAERIAQSQLNQKHSGGQQDSKGNVVYAGFDIVDNLAKIPKTFPHRAAIAELDGTVDKIEPAAQGGSNIYVDGKVHYVAPDLAVQVEKGQKVEAGDQLSSGIINPADAVRYKGIGEGRRYFANRMTQAFRDTKYDVNRRNVEVLARAMIDHVAVSEPEGLGNFLPGDVISYNALADSYKPRKDAQMLEPRKAVGQYLEEPALHYTIGTRVTKQMADRLKKFGVQSVLSHSQPAGFTPNMVSVIKVPQYGDDWMARLGSTYLQSRLLQDIQQGAESRVHGLHPLPGIAKGVEFGRPKGKKFGF